MSRHDASRLRMMFREEAMWKTRIFIGGLHLGAHSREPSTARGSEVGAEMEAAPGCPRKRGTAG